MAVIIDTTKSSTSCNPKFVVSIYLASFVAGAIAVPQLILKECKNLNIRKSIIARVIMSFGFLIAFIVVSRFDLRGPRKTAGFVG